MNSSKLYSILEHFDKYEQNRCRKYIISPYFNRNQALIDLYDVLIKNINSMRPKELTREIVWSKIHEDKKFDDVRCRKYLSDLLKLVEGFLSQLIYEENELQKAANLIESVGDRKIKKLFNSTMRTAERTSEKHPYWSSDFYYYRYLIEMKYYDLTQSELHRSDKTNLSKIIENLDYFYFSEKLRLYCSVLSRQRVSSHKYEISFIEEIVKHIKNNEFKDSPAVLIYYQVYLTTIDSEKEENYFRLKDLLTRFSLKFPLEEAYQIYTYAINYCIKRVNKGNSKFLSELFDLYDELVKSSIILKDKELSPWTFQNIVFVSLRLGKYEWTEEFINSFKEYIPTIYRDNAVSYNQARLRFYEKKFNEVIALLSEVEYEEYSYNLGSKVLLMATYYEIDEVEPLYFLFESFRAYLNRHKDIPMQRRNNYKNLIKFTKKLMKVPPGDKEAVKKLNEEVAKTKGIANVEWLKEKIAELEK